MLILGAPALCQAALYSATATVLDAATGRASWEGPDDSQTLNVQSGTHSADSTFSYFSGWSGSTVNCSADASASLDDSLIILTATNSTNGYGYNYTQAAASASVSFTLDTDQSLSLNDSAGYVDASQVSWSLNGPDGWTWTGPLGSYILAPAGNYTFSIGASAERMAGEDFASTNTASLEFASEPTVPEPGDTLLMIFLPLVLTRKRLGL